MSDLAQVTSAGMKSEQVRRPDALKLFIAGLLIIIAGFIAHSVAMGYNLSFLQMVQLTIASAIGGYMAMNIGANDVANNVGPSVGSNVLSLTGAIIIAGIFEASGALIAGGDVVNTIRKGIIDPDMIRDTQTFIWLMMAALMAGAVWLNLATVVGAPVSTTHSIVGGVLGAGMAAAKSIEIVDWVIMGKIAASWVASPVMGGIIAAAFLLTIKMTITYRKDMLAAAQKMVPILVSIMAWALSTYLIVKGVKKLIKLDFSVAATIGVVIAIIVYFVMRNVIKKAIIKGKKLHEEKHGNLVMSEKESKRLVNRLFAWPVIIAVAFLSFAHGANDVANSIGPLAAIHDAVISSGELAKKAAIPLWVMIIGAGGIVAGLALYGKKLIKTVGSEITDMDESRAFCIAMAAAITVIIASQMGIPVSTTHIAVGAVFGIGFLRERRKAVYRRMIEDIEHHHEGEDAETVHEYLESFQDATIPERGVMLENLKNKTDKPGITAKERRALKKMYSVQLVKRNALYRIGAAWVITVPASGLLAAITFFTIRGMMLP